MKRLVFIVVLLALSLSSYAKNEAKADSVCDLSARISNNLLNTIIPDLQKLDSLLTAELDSLQKRERMYADDLNNLKDNEDYKKLFIQKQFTVEDYIASFKSLDSINVYREEIVLKLEPYKEQPLAKTYLLIIDMFKSLDSVYEIGLNKKLISEATKIKIPFNEHLDGYTLLLWEITNYRPAMYELSRLFKIIDENNISENDTEWVLANIADERLLEIPFFERMLRKYLNKGITQEDEETLYKACPKAFPQFAK